MLKKWLFPLLALLFLLIAVSFVYPTLAEKYASDGNTGDTTKRETEETIMAQDFTVLDKDGAEIQLSSLYGKPLILNFWASWCGPCKSEMPDFQRAFEEYGDSVTFMMVNITDGSRETMTKAAAFVAEQGYTFPVYYDTDLEASNLYGISSIPTTYAIDKEGAVVGYAKGALSESALRDVIAQLTSE